MPRTLPWLTGNAVKQEATPQKRTVKHDPDSDHDKTPKASKNAGHFDNEKSDILRSSSPSTDPIRRCPSEEYLIEGYDNDDIWMMVEDEFYTVAQTFTQHMHYAEYIRRTKEAKAQNAARIQDIARPTDGVTPMSEDMRKRKEAEVLAERQKEGLGQLKDDADADADGGGGDAEKAGVLEEDALLQDGSLAGTSLYDLMMSPRKARSLVGSRGIKSSTRAAAGYVQTLQQSGSSAAATPSSPLGHGTREQQYTMAEDETASDDDDDLDVQPATTFKRTLEDIKAHKTEKSEPSKPSIAPTKYVSHEPVKTNQPKTTPSISARSINPPSIPQPRKRMLFDDDFDRLPEPKPNNNVSIRDTPAKRDPSSSSSSSSSTGNKQSPSNPGGGVDNKPKLESKRSRLNEVPTFLL